MRRNQNDEESPKLAAKPKIDEKKIWKTCQGQQRHISICEGCFCSLTKLCPKLTMEAGQRHLLASKLQMVKSSSITYTWMTFWKKKKHLICQGKRIKRLLNRCQKCRLASFFDVELQYVFHFFVCCHVDILWKEANVWGNGVGNCNFGWLFTSVTGKHIVEHS